jgi:hypothetical protein
MPYIQHENITGDGSETEFTLEQNFRNGTCRIEYNGRLFYEYREVSPNKIKFDFAPSADDSVKVSYYTVNEAGRLNAVRYLTPKQYSELSGSGNENQPTDEGVEKKIREAEIFIDSFCGFWEKAHEHQQLMFPRHVDRHGDEHYPAVPKEITKATTLFIDMILNWNTDGNGEVTEESMGNYSYKKTVTPQKVETIDDRLLPVKTMLKGFRKLTGKMNINI